MELLVIVGLVLIGAIVAIIANRTAKSVAPTIETTTKPKRDANGRFVKKGTK